MVPCKDCITLAICKGIVTDGIETLKLHEDVIKYVDTVYNHEIPVTNLKSFLTYQNVNYIIFILAERCSLLSQYIEIDEDRDERYWNIREYFNLNQGECSDDDITVV